MKNESAYQPICKKVISCAINMALVDTLAARLSMNWVPADLDGRTVLITVTNANYGTPSSVIIEFVGSPPRFVIFMSNVKAAPGGRTLVVNEKITRQHSAAHAKACAAIDEFLIAHGVL